MNKETVAGVTIGVVLLLSVSAAAYFAFFKKPSAAPPPSAPVNKVGDINHDGAVDAEDAEFIRASSPCNHVDPCWKKVVGKTKDGDNPIYVFDLDLNHDDNVNELDTSAMAVQ